MTTTTWTCPCGNVNPEAIANSTLTECLKCGKAAPRPVEQSDDERLGTAILAEAAVTMHLDTRSAARLVAAKARALIATPQAVECAPSHEDDINLHRFLCTGIPDPYDGTETSGGKAETDVEVAIRVMREQASTIATLTTERDELTREVERLRAQPAAHGLPAVGTPYAIPLPQFQCKCGACEYLRRKQCEHHGLAQAAEFIPPAPSSVEDAPKPPGLPRLCSHGCRNCIECQWVGGWPSELLESVGESNPASPPELPAPQGEPKPEPWKPLGIRAAIHRAVELFGGGAEQRGVFNLANLSHAVAEQCNFTSKAIDGRIMRVMLAGRDDVEQFGPSDAYYRALCHCDDADLGAAKVRRETCPQHGEKPEQAPAAKPDPLARTVGDKPRDLMEALAAANAVAEPPEAQPAAVDPLTFNSQEAAIADEVAKKFTDAAKQDLIGTLVDCMDDDMAPQQIAERLVEDYPQLLAAPPTAADAKTIAGLRAELALTKAALDVAQLLQQGAERELGEAHRLRGLEKERADRAELAAKNWETAYDKATRELATLRAQCQVECDLVAELRTKLEAAETGCREYKEAASELLDKCEAMRTKLEQAVVALHLPSPGGEFVAKVTWKHADGSPDSFVWCRRKMDFHTSAGFQDTRGVEHRRDDVGITWALTIPLDYPDVTGLPHLCPKCGVEVPASQVSQTCGACGHSLVFPYYTKPLTKPDPETEPELEYVRARVFEGTHADGNVYIAAARLDALAYAATHESTIRDLADEVKRLEGALAEANASLQLICTDSDGVWRWQGDGNDEPGSLTCPVVMSAEKLRELAQAALRAQGTPWPVRDVLAKLADAADILLNDKDYDGHGWEGIGIARDAARSILAASAPTTEGAT